MKTCPTCNRSFIDGQDNCPLDDAQLAVVNGRPPAGLGRVLGSYRLVGLLGEGGMGTIYVGQHVTLNRYVAIKILRPELAGRKENIARFFEEAHTVNTIKHPNIIESIDLVEDVVDGAYCVLELLRGPDLKTLLHAGALPVASAIQVGAQIADALAAVHEKGIVHRDLKPENLILIEKYGRPDFVKLIDFGVAQMSEHGEAGVPFGTAAYMAPEQAAGERVDGRADIYSLGVLLFEMVTGRHPFPSNTEHEYMLRHAHDPPPRPAKVAPRGVVVPPAFEALIMRCLEKDPAARYTLASELANALRSIKVRSGSGAWKWAAFGTFVVAAGAAAVLVVPGYLGGDHPAQAAATPPPPPVVAPREPEPPPPPAETATPDVRLKFTSTPPGANVIRTGETVPLGITPFEITLPHSSHALHVTYELDGYESRDTDVPLAKSEDVVEVALSLTAVPTSETPPPTITDTKPRKKNTYQREGVIDPFAPH